jgi:tetratricopeptide (TPR) repeat protein
MGTTHPSAGLPPLCERIITLCQRRPARALLLAERFVQQTQGDAQCLPWSELVLGHCLLLHERLAEATLVLQRALVGLQHLEELYGVYHAEHCLLLTGLLHKGTPEDLAAWEQLAERCARLGWPLDAARVRVGQMRLLNTLGRSAEALLLADRIATTFAQAGAADMALFQRTLGIALLQTGALPAASHALEQAEQRFAALRYRAEQAKTWFEQGRLTFYQDGFQQALAIQQRAYATFVALGLSLRAAFCQKNIGAYAIKLGDLDTAIPTLLQARALFQRSGQQAHMADCDLNLGNAAFHGGMDELALSAWQQAETMYAAAGHQSMVVISRRNQALALTRLGQLTQAEAMLLALLPSAQALRAQGDHAEIVRLRGEIAALRGQHAEAIGFYTEAEALFQRIPNAPAAARTVAARGWLYLHQGQVREAEALFDQASDQLKESPLYYWPVLHGLGRCYEVQGKPDLALAYYKQACAAMNWLRRKQALEYASSALFVQAEPLFADAVRLACGQDDALSVFELAEQQRGLALDRQMHAAAEPFVPSPLRKAYEHYRTLLRQVAAPGASCAEFEHTVHQYLRVVQQLRHTRPPTAPADAMDLDVAELRRQLGAAYPQGWVVLSYLVSGDSLLIAILDANGLMLETVVLDGRLRRRLARANQASDRKLTYFAGSLPDAPAQIWDDLTALGATLIPAAVRARLHPDCRLILSPCGILSGLAWGALRIEGRWLAEQAIIQLVPGVLHWASLRHRQPASDRGLVLGIGTFHGRAADLPNALPSLDVVARCWKGMVDRWEEGMVTRQRLLQFSAEGTLHQYGLIHLTTHGQLLTRQALFAHLKLADDDLFVDEITHLRLGGALVVLIACDGASEEELPGEERLSLHRAVLAAGARDVIASIWTLYDTMLEPMLTPLYTALAAGVDAPTAVALAQRSCIAQGRQYPERLLERPLFWAGFTALGGG